MCGIAGIFSNDANEKRDILGPMMENLVHRGPDEEGVFKDEKVHLGVRRLRVIDLVTGSQPIKNEDGNIVVVYNGEIFNFKELRLELQAAGHVFATQTDTEVLVHGYEQWGQEVVDRLNGQFAFALWDGQKLFIARDRMGEKPLYYAMHEGRLIFASEIKAILTHVPSHPDIDESFWVFDAPVMGRTIFAGIHELPAAHWMTYDGRNLQIGRYWEIPNGPISEKSETELVDELRELLIDAVNIRMVADVPVGMFLSGGIDSAAIACIAKPDVAFSCHFPLGEKFDELHYAQTVARQIKARHVVVSPTYDDMRSRLRRVIRHLDQPIATASTISEFMLAEAAQKDGVKVILGGQGADEIFGGYIRYLLMSIEEGMGRSPELKNYHSLARYFWTPTMFENPAKRYFRLIHRATPADERPYIKNVEKLFSRHQDLLDKMGFCDTHISLPSLLTMNDRACASYGLENRCPFLDHRIVEFAFRLPPGLKIQQRTTKAILRKALRGIVPDQILDRNDKKGLVVPFRRWLTGPLAHWAERLEFQLAARLQIPKGSGRGEFDRAFYTRVCLELWFQNYFPDYPHA
jgi:asparagine synthase (glutamine-hydrolysing)